MVKAEVIDPNTGKKYVYYMDGRLNYELTKKVLPDLNQQDEDWVVCVDGGERTGKSVFAMQLGKFIDPSLSLDRVTFSPDEFKRAIIGARRRQCVIFDESYRGFAAKGALTEINRILEGMMMEMGQKNLFVIVTLPTYFLLSKYVALFRTRGLFHVYKNRRRKGFWMYFNKKKKLRLYQQGKKELIYPIRTGFKGRFLNYYTVNEQEYREKKAEAFKKGYRVTKDQNFLAQRNRMINMLYNDLNYNQVDIAEMFARNNIPLKRAAIGAILNQFKKNTLEEHNSSPK